MFEFIINIFDILLYRPLFNALVLLYNCIPGHDFGIAVILLTLIIRVILYPIAVKSLNSQKVLQKLQPKLQEIQTKYKDDKEKQAKETMEFYRAEKINPFSGLFLAFIQLPILIAIYRVFWQGLKPSELLNLYSFVLNPININASFLGLVDLSKPNIAFAILAGILQFFQTKMISPGQKSYSAGSKDGQKNQFSEILQKEMLYIFPIFTVFILLKLPSAIGLYWIVNTLFAIIQQYFTFKPGATKPAVNT